MTWQGIYATAARDRTGGIAIRHVDGAETYVQPGDDADDLAATLDQCDDDLTNIDALLCDRLEGIEPME